MNQTRGLTVALVIIMVMGLALLCTAEATPEAGASFVQECLLVMGYPPGPVDGKVGPRTTRALERYLDDRFGKDLSSVSDEEATDRFFLDCRQAYATKGKAKTFTLYRY